MNVSLILLNANVLTLGQSCPRADAVAVAGGRIAAVGGNGEILRFAQNDRCFAQDDIRFAQGDIRFAQGDIHFARSDIRFAQNDKRWVGRTQVIDCQGLALLPGFNDAHCHLPGLGRRLQDLDCGAGGLSGGGVTSVAALQAAVRQWAAGLPAGAWVRGYGYDERRMCEGRHPNRWELDAAAPGHPVWLEHRSGHAAALNSRALDLAGIHRETPDPPGGVIERDPVSGEPTGTLFELRSFLRQRLGNTRSPQEFEDGMRAAGQLLGGYGITSVQDAGADNGIERWRAFRRLQADGVLSCRITMFAGMERLDELAAAGLSFGSGDNWLRLGHAKIMLTLTAGALHPSAAELARLVAGAHRRGFPVALHCVEEEAIAVAADVLASQRRTDWRERSRPTNHSPDRAGVAVADRIEHCAEGGASLVDAVRRSGAAVVTQPGFIYHNGAAYRRNVAPRLLPHLYPAGALHRAGVAVAFGSDAPVIDPNPWPAIYGAVTRRAGDGERLSGDGAGDGQAVDVATALRMYTTAGAVAEGLAGEKGAIVPGMLADMVLVDADPLAVEHGGLPGIRAVMTVIDGAVVWGR